MTLRSVPAEPATAHVLYEVGVGVASDTVTALRDNHVGNVWVDQAVRPIDASELLVRVESTEPAYVRDDGSDELARRTSPVLAGAGIAYRLVGHGLRPATGQRRR
jgi:hypothetical protein